MSPLHTLSPESWEDTADDGANTAFSQVCFLCTWSSSESATLMATGAGAQLSSPLNTDPGALQCRSTPPASDLHKPSQVRRGNQKEGTRGLAWWHSGKESSCKCSGHRFDPWSGKIPHASEQLSPCATTTEPGKPHYWAQVLQLLNPEHPRARAPQREKPRQWEACTLQLERWAPIPVMRESPCSHEDPAQPKLNQFNYFFLIKEEERKKQPEKPLPTKGSPKQLFSDPVPDALETEISLRVSLEPLICTVGLCRVAACHPIRQSSVSLLQEHHGTRPVWGVTVRHQPWRSNNPADSHNSSGVDTGPRWLCARPYLTEQKRRGKSACNLCLWSRKSIWRLI